MNQPIRRVALFCFLLITALLVSSNYLQVVNADSYKARPGNMRTVYDAFAYPRGQITTADGTVIAGSKLSGGITLKYQRTYPLGGAYGNITGYKSPSYGSTDLEFILNKYLQGTDSSESVANFMDTLTGKSKKGGDVQLTLQNSVQQAAITAMKGREGSVVALDPTTGAILAMYSNPTFDPNGISSNDGDAASAAGKALEADKTKPNLNHATQELYPPGSVFKVITAAAALDTGKFTETDPTGANAHQYPANSTGYTLVNENKDDCPGTDLKAALAASCNSVYGYVGAQLGAQTIADYAGRFGFNNPGLKIPLPVVSSTFPADKLGNDQLGLAQASVGQGDTSLTPLQAAMIAAAVANDGKIMQPYLVDKETAPNGHVTYQGKDHQHLLSQAVSPQTAAMLDDMMQNVVTNGTGSGLGIEGAKVGAKTGTAQRGTGQNPLAWYVSYATMNGKSVAVAVMIKTDNPNLRDSISGHDYAGPVAKAVEEAALGVGKH
ncbi:penicillin-binding transpeptidase domain-containing protein [Catenulispora subtropica]|uniref:Penicillin-binding transpeptidase domain-containing protein n=1 Tax=Catenulispora subtropica TaxID=450798 RepID=A0ABP5C7R9_9ACTN